MSKGNEMSLMETVKKGDRLRVTMRKPAGFRPVTGCTQRCCAPESTDDVIVVRVNRKQGTLAVNNGAGGWTFNPDHELVVSVEAL